MKLEYPRLIICENKIFFSVNNEQLLIYHRTYFSKSRPKSRNASEEFENNQILSTNQKSRQQFSYLKRK